jgi:hypothetical protein
MIAQVDEQHPAMVPDPVTPPGQPNGLADVAGAERAASVGSVTMHGKSELSRAAAVMQITQNSERCSGFSLCRRSGQHGARPDLVPPHNRRKKSGKNNVVDRRARATSCLACVIEQPWT